jgi:hypothetical protein
VTSLRPRQILRNHTGLFIALLVYLLLAFSYFFIVPIFEGPDEWTHTGHVKYIAEGDGLPVMLPGRGIWGGQQPPLYYAIGAILVQPFDLDGVENYEQERRNPHAAIGYALDPGNKNNYLHSPTEDFPYRGLSLTVHILRLFSMVFGIIAIIFTYLAALELLIYQTQIFPSAYCLLPASRYFSSSKFFATLAALVVACHPMFNFITASVANETANIALCTIGLWLSQRYVLRGPSQHPGRAIALGVTLGFIALAKMTGLSLGLVAVVAFLIASFSTRKQSGAAHLLWRDGLIIGLLFLTIGGWWYWRNYQLYGDFFQSGLYKIYFGVDPQPLTLTQFLDILAAGEVSFWATFGWLNIAAPDWVYGVYRVVSRIGLIGVIATPLVIMIRSKFFHPLLRVPQTPFTIARWFSPLLLHLLFPIALAFSLTRLVSIEGGMQGRQLLPALGSIAIIIVWGWWMLSTPRIRLWVMTILTLILLGIAVWLPFSVVTVAYIPKPVLTEAELPADLHRLDRIYNNQIKLIGVDIGATQVQPGGLVPVTAYWQALQPMTTDYSVFVHLIGRNYANIGQINTYPAFGLRPTTTLEPGQIIADTYPVRVNGGSEAPAHLLVNMGLFDFREAGRPGIQAVDTEGNPVSPTIGELKLIPAQWPAIDNPLPVAEFADNISLVSAQLENCSTNKYDCRITFTWLAQTRPTADYTVFIQLWRNDQFAAGFDSPPLNNNYPTRLWDAGEVIVDVHRLNLSTLPPGKYRILTGLYNFATGQRLPATANGEPLPDYALDLGTIQIGER